MTGADCDVGIGWVTLAFAVGTFVGAAGGATAAGLGLRASRRPLQMINRRVEHGRAFDLDDAGQRARFEELLRRDRGQP
jgi:hypothetical protein